METVFLRILNISITAGFIVFAAILYRLLFCKEAKSIRLIVWGLLAIRLLIPVSIESPLSLIPNGESIRFQNQIEDAVNGVDGQSAIEIHLGIASMDHVTEIKTVNAGGLLWIASIAWIVGLAIMLLYFFMNNFRVHRMTRGAVPKGRNVYVLKSSRSSFVYGFFRPRIYISEGMDPNIEHSVILHEQTHIAYGDHIAKAIGFLLLAVYWFDPLIWIAYLLFSRDLEFACDERVIRRISENERADYATAVLRFGEDRNKTPITAHFAEIEKKTRIKAILSYRKPVLWVTIASLIMLVTIGVTLLTNPIKANEIDKKPANLNWSEESFQAGVIVDVMTFLSEEYLCVVYPDSQQALVFSDNTVKVTQYPKDQLVKVDLISMAEADYLLHEYNLPPERVKIRIVSNTERPNIDRNLIREAFASQYRLPNEITIFKWEE